MFAVLSKAAMVLVLACLLIACGGGASGTTTPALNEEQPDGNLPGVDEEQPSETPPEDNDQNEMLFACTEVLGFSQTRQWFEHFNLVNWQGRVRSGASIDEWADPDFAGWSVPLTNEVCAIDEVDRVVLTISGEQRSVDEWASAIDDVISLIRSRYSAVDKILLQPVVGGPGETVCDRNGSDVRASVNHPVIDQAIVTLIGDDVGAGVSPLVQACEHYSDVTGHLTETGAAFVAATLETFYSNGNDVQSAAIPWTAYFSTQGTAADWADNARGVASSLTGNNGLEDVFDDALVDARVAELKDRVAEKILAQNVSVIVPVGGLGSGRSQDVVNAFMALIESDNGERFKEIVRRQTRGVGQLANSGKRVTWQVGNEINSRHYSETMRTWAQAPLCVDGDAAGDAEDAVAGCTNDSFYIDLYVEYFLAPSVEAINAVSTELFGHQDVINISLGTLANARNQGAHTWVETLLNYEVQGQYAPTLAGRKVYELVDILTTHYIVSSNGSDEWRNDLAALRDRWIGVGRIKAQWSTEEVGIRAAEGGRGGFVGLRTFARYMTWWLENSYGPENGRVSYYGWKVGPSETTISEALDIVYHFIGSTSLEIVDTSSRDGNVEMYGFTAPNGKIVVVAMLDTQLPTGTLTNVVLPWQAIDEVRIDAYRLSAAGTEALTTTAALVDGDLSISLNDVALNDAAVLLLITP